MADRLPVRLANESALGVYRFSWTSADGARVEVQWGEGMGSPLWFRGDVAREIARPERFGWKTPRNAADFKRFAQAVADEFEAGYDDDELEGLQATDQAVRAIANLGAAMTPQSASRADKDNLGPHQFYYRAHRKDAEFIPDDAWSLAIDGDSEEERGYSAFRSLPELHAYISSRKYPDLTDSMARGERIVIRFTGYEVGEGADGEPLVVPYNSDHEIVGAGSVAWHRAIGPELIRIRNRLAEISGEIMSAWPRRSVASDRASAVVGPVDRLRDELAAQFRRHHKGDYSPDTYFPLHAAYEPIHQHAALPQEYARDRRPTEHGLSPERHQAIGPELARVRGRLAEICGDVGRAWPRPSLANDRASAVAGPLDRLRDELAAQFRRDHEGDYRPDTYYPPAAAREAQDNAASSQAAAAGQVTANAPGKATSAIASGKPAEAKEGAEALFGPHALAADSFPQDLPRGPRTGGSAGTSSGQSAHGTARSQPGQSPRARRGGGRS